MGEEVADQEFSGRDRTAYRAKNRQCLAVFAKMLHQTRFDLDDTKAGLEIELNLVDSSCGPAMRNLEVLEQVADSDFQTELGQWNVEINVAPRHLTQGGVLGFSQPIRASLNRAEERASQLGAHLVMIGILPTLESQHISAGAITPNPRFKLLSDQILQARGEDILIDITGKERLELQTGSIMPEAACTSTQLHLQVAPADFAAHWNASQAIAGVQLAVGANSPYFLGHDLWAETRIPLFKQATDTRSEELKAQGVRPRVWFGERWITSIFDLFEENVRYFPALLPVVSEENPEEVFQQGRVPELAELRLHNGTVYRWNRPIYDISDGQPHLRIENRVLSAGPTVIDTLANAAFYFGLVRYLARAERPVWSQMTFPAALDNFTAGARDGIDAVMYWPNVGRVAARELVLDHLIPKAAAGLHTWGVDVDQVELLLGVIEGRCQNGVNGASWLRQQVHTSQAAGASRGEALRLALNSYRTHMHTNQPVHTW